MIKIKETIRKNKRIYSMLSTTKKNIRCINRYIKTKKYIKKQLKIDKKRVYYLGKPVHPNLGDLAQGICIRKWIQKNYPDRTIIEIETEALVNTNFSLLNFIRKVYNQDDFIVFQSGYTTTDLGGYADEMHRTVMEKMPHARMLMMPQTIFFRKEENKKKTSEIYNRTKNMLFLARDRISYKMAVEMFPDIPIEKYPDIVTTLIGKYTFKNKRNGVLICCRDDGEKYYSDSEIQELKEKCETFAKVSITDTTKNGKIKNIVKEANKYIKKEIEEYSKYKVIITDRYHGTIFSLIAGTPVIIIKTTDHKVTTGAEWFKGVYDDYVYVADSLENAYKHAEKIYNKKMSNKLDSFFEKEYYDKLPKLFEERCDR